MVKTENIKRKKQKPNNKKIKWFDLKITFYHFIPTSTRMAIIKKKKKGKRGKMNSALVSMWRNLYVAFEDVKWCSRYEKHFDGSSKT